MFTRIPVHTSKITNEGEEMNGEAALLWGVLFGSVGLGFFIYGKKQSRLVPLVCGLALMLYPYFISNVVALVLVGLALIIVPYFFRY
jgi:hypothetical protein